MLVIFYYLTTVFYIIGKDNQIKNKTTISSARSDSLSNSNQSFKAEKSKNVKKILKPTTISLNQYQSISEQSPKTTSSKPATNLECQKSLKVRQQNSEPPSLTYKGSMDVHETYQEVNTMSHDTQEHYLVNTMNSYSENSDTSNELPYNIVDELVDEQTDNLYRVEVANNLNKDDDYERYISLKENTCLNDEATNLTKNRNTVELNINDNSDNVSEAGTYTIESDIACTEEESARSCIDDVFGVNSSFSTETVIAVNDGDIGSRPCSRTRKSIPSSGRSSPLHIVVKDHNLKTSPHMRTNKDIEASESNTKRGYKKIVSQIYHFVLIFFLVYWAMVFIF